MSNRQTVIGLVIGLVTVCLCACAVGLAITGGVLFYQNVVRTPASPPTPVTSETPASQLATPGADQQTGMDAIQQWVIDQRGLTPTGPVERKFLNPAQVLERTRKNFEKDTSPEEIRDGVRTLAVLGLIRPGLDLYDLLIRLHSEGISGFYDPDTKELVVVSDAGQLNTYEKVTFAHEYNHALQDQIYGVRAMGFSDEGFEQDPEKASALQALLEGDASLLEEQYKASLTPAELLDYDQIAGSFDTSIYTELPDYLLRDFAFPYTRGLDFVRRYYEQGGWARVDEVWRNPPRSTEQIMHPERYDSGDNPLPVPPPALTDTLGAGWRQIDSGSVGEWYTYLILAYGEDANARLARAEAARAAAGWGGDSYVAFYNEAQAQTVLAAHWQWDVQPEADEFAASFKHYGNQRFGQADLTEADHVCWSKSAEQHCLYFTGVHTLWLAGPDQATIDKLLPLYPELTKSSQQLSVTNYQLLITGYW